MAKPYGYLVKTVPGKAYKTPSKYKFTFTFCDKGRAGQSNIGEGEGGGF